METDENGPEAWGLLKVDLDDLTLLKAELEDLLLPSWDDDCWSFEPWDLEPLPPLDLEALPSLSWDLVEPVRLDLDDLL